MIPFICVNKLAERKKSSCKDFTNCNSFRRCIEERWMSECE